MNTRTANEAILSRMQGTQDFHPARGFHPASANLFADWTLEPGDVLTVRSEGTDYAVPVYTMDMSWNGDSTVRVQSSGNKQRDPPSELARRNYGYSRGQRKLEEGETEIRAELVNMGNSIGLVVTETAGGGKVVNAASIVAEINRQTGQSQVLLHGDQIDLDGYVTTISLAANSSISADILTANDVLYAHSAYLAYGSDYSAIPCNADLEDSKVATELSLTRSGDTYTLSWKDYDGTPHSETFSRATTLTGAWSSGTYTVTASPQGDQVSTTPNLQLNGANMDNFSAELLTDDSTPAVTKSIYGYLGIEGSGASRVVKVYKNIEKTQSVAQISVPDGTRTATALTATAVNSSSIETTVTYDDGNTTTGLLLAITGSVVFSGGSATARVTSNSHQGNIKTESVPVSASVNSCSQSDYAAATNVLATAGIHTGTYYLAKVTVAGKAYNIKLFGS